MKNFFQIIGVIVLVIGSFVYTEEVSTTAKNTDELLQEIKKKSCNYKIDSSEAIIFEDTIIPGINGKEVNVDKSYKEMRKIGMFDEKLIIYNKMKINYSLDENLNKYIISGNPDKKEIALIFKVDNNDDINSIVDVLNYYKVKGSFFVTSVFVEKNNELVLSLLSEEHTIGNLSNNGDYTSPDFVWMKTVITTTSRQRNYCYLEEKNKKVLDICKYQNSRTIIPTKVIKKHPFVELKNNLTSGAMISFNVDSKIKKELKNIINYVESRGYKIVSLEKLLTE